MKCGSNGSGGNAELDVISVAVKMETMTTSEKENMKNEGSLAFLCCQNSNIFK